MSIQLEICVDTIAGIDAAIEGGGDRVELCSAMGVGGLTPPASLIRAAAAKPMPAHLLSRPREGGFVYTPAEQALIAGDIRTAAEAGLAGVVIGASDARRQLDAALLARWIALARELGGARGVPLAVTLHRAFDLTPDLPAALETVIALGFDRILTSGGTPRAVDGAAMLAKLHRQAAGRIAVMAGSGVTPDTLPAILATGVRDVHASCRTAAHSDPDAPERRFGFVSSAAADTDPALVRILADAVHDYA